MKDCKPSQICLECSFPPLAGTFGRSELEAAAVLLVWANQCAGDEWQPMRPQDIGAALELALESPQSPVARLARNPFFRLDFRGLVSRGFARFTSDAEHAPIEFTAGGLEIMDRFTLCPVKLDTPAEPR